MGGNDSGQGPPVARSLTLASDVVATARALAPRSWMLGAAATVCLAVSWLADGRWAQVLGLSAGLGLAAAAIALRVLAGAAGLSDRRVMARLALLVGADAAPCFTTDDVGQIGYANEAARDRFRAAEGATLASALGDHFANPGAVLFRLQSRAANLGSAREDVVTRRGHMRLSVHRIAQRRFLWRIEEFVERAASGRGGGGVSLPMLVANKAGVVLFSNEAMRRLVGERPRRLDRIFATPVLHSGEEVEVTTAEGPVRAYLAEIEGPGERREIYLLPAPERGEADHMLADFEHVPVALLKFRPDGTLRTANRAARELVGAAEGDTRRFDEIFDGPGRPAADWLDDVLAERLPVASEVVALRTEGEAFVQVTLRRLVDGGRPGILAVVQDATAMKTLETQFAQSQKMQAIGQLAGGIAHDFNNLLTAISGHCDLLLVRRGPDDPEFADLVQIRQTTNRAAALVGQLLAFSRKQTLKPGRIDLQEVLSDLIHLLNRLVGGRLRIRVAHAPDLGAIRADKRQIEQVLMNLVVNARDAMPDGGAIRIETEALTLREELRRDGAVVPAGDYAVMRVQDSGQGIPPEQLDKIFEPFFTTKRLGEGTGLGLSTVYGIVKQSGGFIFVDSVVGQGSTFELLFPIHEAMPEAEAPEPTPALQPAPGAVSWLPDAAGEPALPSPVAHLALASGGMPETAPETLPALRFGSRRAAFATDGGMPAETAVPPADAACETGTHAPPWPGPPEGTSRRPTAPMWTGAPTEGTSLAATGVSPQHARAADAATSGPDGDDVSGATADDRGAAGHIAAPVAMEGAGMTGTRDEVPDPILAILRDLGAVSPLLSGASAPATVPAASPGPHPAPVISGVAPSVSPFPAPAGFAAPSAGAGVAAPLAAEGSRGTAGSTALPLPLPDDSQLPPAKAPPSGAAPPDQGAAWPTQAGPAAAVSTPVPASAAGPARAPLPRASGAERDGARVVLLVEDEAPVRAFASRALQLRGFRVIEASSAEEALAILADRDLQVDVFVTDVMMPGMDGPSWVRRALEDRPQVRVIFVSGFAEDQVDRACARIPGAAFLPKPFSLGELTALVQGQFLH